MYFSYVARVAASSIVISLLNTKQTRFNKLCLTAVHTSTGCGKSEKSYFKIHLNTSRKKCISVYKKKTFTTLLLDT